jgi:hypothetical protein
VPTEGIHDPPLAVDVMGGGEDRRDRRASQRPPVTGRVLDAVRQIRATRGDQEEAQRRLEAVDVLAQPGGDAGRVDAGKVVVQAAALARGVNRTGMCFIGRQREARAITRLAPPRTALALPPGPKTPPAWPTAPRVGGGGIDTPLLLVMRDPTPGFVFERPTHG